MLPIKVFVIDDSAVVRQTMLHLLSDHPDLVFLGSASNPLVAMPALKKNRPDVLLLDIEMPGMDGLTFLRQLMAEDPIPTVICSTLTSKGSKVALDALSAGAVAIIGKPSLGLKQFLEESRHEFVQTLKAAARAKPRIRQASTPRPAGATTPPARPAPLAQNTHVHTFAVNKPIVIGSSTGGTQALEIMLVALPADAPGIAITQHMPERFTAMYAERLNGMCQMKVKEAQDGDRLERGVVLIAPGGRHMQLRKAAGQYYVKVFDGPPVNRHKPSVDVLFKSTADVAGSDALALLLTGMGDDGARGMKLMHERGARTIAQDEASCVVFGMPMEAIKLNAVDEVLPLHAMANAIMRFDAKA
jgi:two-component system, chemotaxis family, protein-glutamate methylesterase/glutaminase